MADSESDAAGGDWAGARRPHFAWTDWHSKELARVGHKHLRKVMRVGAASCLCTATTRARAESARADVTI